MPLDRKKLERVVDLADGMIRARCPACAEKGQDKKGEHLRVYPDGRFGCCVFPRDREHRKRIFALAGERVRQGIKVRVATAKPVRPIQSGILGKLGQVFGGSAPTYITIGATDATDGSAQLETGFGTLTDAADGVREAEARLVESRTLRTGETKSSGELEILTDEARTLRTPDANSKHDSAWNDSLPLSEDENPRTPRTPIENPRVYSKKDLLEEGVQAHTHKGFREGVRSVREGGGANQPPEPAGNQKRMPYLMPDGTLVIPFDSPERYHWWKPGGQRVAATLAEVRSKEQGARSQNAASV